MKTTETGEEFAGRLLRIQANADNAAARGDQATAARLRETAQRMRLSGPPPQPRRTPATPRPAAAPPPADGHVRLTTGTGLSESVHLVVGPRRIRCRRDRDLVPTTKYHPTDEPVTCKRCINGIARDDADPDDRPAPSARRDSPARRTGGEDVTKAFRVEEPLPPLEHAEPLPEGAPTEGATAGDLAALMLGCPVDSRRPLRVIGTLNPASTVGVMVSADGSVVLMAVD